MLQCYKNVNMIYHIIQGTNNAKPRNKISFSLYMEAISIVNNKQRLQNKNIINNELTIKDYLAIKVYKSLIYFIIV